MTKAIQGLVEAQVKTNEKMSKLEKQIAKEEEAKEDKEDYVQDDKKETLNFIHVKNLRDVLIKNHIKCFFFASFSILVKRYFKKGLII